MYASTSSSRTWIVQPSGRGTATVSAGIAFLLHIQSASLVLTTTPAEEMALGLRAYLGPLRLLGAPVDEIALTLLLSLRFMALVFEETRNLALGLAARGVPWRQLPPGGGIQVRLLTM